MSSSRVVSALAALAVPVLTAATLASPAHWDRIGISGVFSMKVGEQHALPVADQAGPVLLLTRSSGTSRSTGPTKFMDGAQVHNREIADLTQGSGPHQGYITEIKGADTTVTSYRGKVVTTLGPDQKPRTSFEGTWSKVSGTGKYQGVSGSGRYEGRMLSPTEYTIEYSGEIVTRRTASR
jgi:hypothetical protein